MKKKLLFGLVLLGLTLSCLGQGVKISAYPNVKSARSNDLLLLSQPDLSTNKNISIGNLFGNLGGLASNSLPFLTISSRGVLNGLSVFTNDGFMFGPDTPGTTTCGIQEALNCIVVRSALQSGLWVQLIGGDYYYTNQIVWTNHAGSVYRLEGSGALSCNLIYAGVAVTNVVLFKITGTYTQTAPSESIVRGIRFTSLTNIPATLLTITNVSDDLVANCSFTSRGSMLKFNESFAALVGLDVGTSLSDKSVVEDCFFSTLATGIKNDADHLHMNHCVFDNIGQQSGKGNAWPITSPHQMGAAVYVPASLTSVDNRYRDCHFYTVHVGIAYDVSGTDIGTARNNAQELQSCVFGSVTFPLAASDANGIAAFQWFGTTVSDNTNASPLGDFSGIEGESRWDAELASATAPVQFLIFNAGPSWTTNATTNFLAGAKRNAMEQLLGDSPNHYFNAPVIAPHAVTTSATNYPITYNDEVVLLAGNHSATLTNAAMCGGRSFTVICSSAGTNRILTVASQTVAGSANGWTNTAVNKFVTVVSDGVNWWVTGASSPP